MCPATLGKRDLCPAYLVAQLKDSILRWSFYSKTHTKAEILFPLPPQHTGIA